MWWRELEAQPRPCGNCGTHSCLHVDGSATVAPDAILDTSGGPITIGSDTRICPGATVCGSVSIGNDCLIGYLALIRGATRIGSGSRIGFSAEVKNSTIGERVSIGPQCFVADSKVEEDAYLGAQVRTSNHRLDKRSVSVVIDGALVDTGREKLGCLIGARAALGIQVIFRPAVTAFRNPSKPTDL